MPYGLEGFKQKVGNFLGSDMMPVALGMGAQAAMGEYQNEWPALAGKAVVDLQRSNIAAKAATRQAEERRALIRLLSGKAITPVDKVGPNKVSYTRNQDGSDLLKIDGNDMAGGIFGEAVGQSALKGATRPELPSSPPPAGSGAPGNVAPQQNRSTNVGVRSLPFSLAQAGGSSGGSGQSLAGLTPEQIGAISRRDMLGGELMNRSISDIFTNMQSQGRTDYLDRMPQEVSKTPKLPTMQVKVGANGNFFTFNNAGQNIDTGIKAPPNTNTSSANYQLTDRVGLDGVRRKVMLKDGIPMKQDLGIVPESTVEDTRDFKIKGELAEIEERIRSDNYVQTDLDNFNSRSEGNFYYKSGTGFFGGREAEKIALPPGVSARDMYYTKQKNPDLSIEKIIEILNAQ